MHLLDLLAGEPLPLVAEADVDLYVRHGQIDPEQGGGELVCVFNLNPDHLPELRKKAIRGGTMPPITNILSEIAHV